MASEAAYSEVKQGVSRQAAAKPAAAHPHPDRHHSNTQPIACVCSSAKPLWVNTEDSVADEHRRGPCWLLRTTTIDKGTRQTDDSHPPLSKVVAHKRTNTATQLDSGYSLQDSTSADNTGRGVDTNIYRECGNVTWVTSRSDRSTDNLQGNLKQWPAASCSPVTHPTCTEVPVRTHAWQWLCCWCTTDTDACMVDTAGRAWA